MPLPLMITISPGETAPCRKLAALANVTLVGPGRREVSVKLVLNVEVAAVTTMVPAFGPAVTVVEACPLAVARDLLNGGRGNVDGHGKYRRNTSSRHLHLRPSGDAPECHQS